MSPDIKFFGSEEKVHVEGQVEAESVPESNGKNRVRNHLAFQSPGKIG